MVSPVNASRLPSRAAAHHSGPKWLAKPCFVENFHLLSFASLSWRTPLLAKSGSSTCLQLCLLHPVVPQNLVGRAIPGISCTAVDCLQRANDRHDRRRLRPRDRPERRDVGRFRPEGRSLCPRALTCRTQNPFCSLWKVTRSISLARTSRCAAGAAVEKLIYPAWKSRRSRVTFLLIASPLGKQVDR